MRQDFSGKIKSCASKNGYFLRTILIGGGFSSFLSFDIISLIETECREFMSEGKIWPHLISKEKAKKSEKNHPLNQNLTYIDQEYIYTISQNPRDSVLG
ncbi:unnamed protein product, partial [marine sediment metagenome]